MASENDFSGKPKRYVRVKWLHEDPYEPIALYYEIKEDGWPIRVIEVYEDGSIESIDPGLIDAAIPPLKEINAMPDFKGKEISKDEFEIVWKKLIEGNSQE